MKLLTIRVVRHREAVDATSLEMFQKRLDKGQNEMIFKVHSNPGHFMIL